MCVNSKMTVLKMWKTECERFEKEIADLKAQIAEKDIVIAGLKNAIAGDKDLREGDQRHYEKRIHALEDLARKYQFHAQYAMVSGIRRKEIICPSCGRFRGDGCKPDCDFRILEEKK